MAGEISSLTDLELHSKLESLSKTERETTQEIIKHLAEVESRKLYLRMGHSSLFDYATKGLGYSEGSAARRIHAAKAIRVRPEIAQYLETGEIKLAALSACAGLIVGEDGQMVVEALRGKSKDEALRLKASLQPMPQRKDSIQPINIGTRSKDQQSFGFENELHRGGDQNSAGIIVEAEQFQVGFTASAAFMEKLRRVQELTFTGSKEDSRLESVLEEALDAFLEKNCPMKRQERREAREAKRSEIAAPSNSDCAEPKKTPSRSIPVKLRDEVLQRDAYQCTYLGPNGVRCSCRKDLEIDHIYPFALGGETSLENLRVLCAAHNWLSARDWFGKEFMESKIRNSVGSGLVHSSGA